MRQTVLNFNYNITIIRVGNKAQSRSLNCLKFTSKNLNVLVPDKGGKTKEHSLRVRQAIFSVLGVFAPKHCTSPQRGSAKPIALHDVSSMTAS